MRSEARLAAHAICACLLSCALSGRGPQERVSWAPVERVIAFADVHADLRWSAGTAHVVSLGDLLDRGAGSRKTMDLLMRLQDEALAAGGALHVLLGNHEAMNLMGDLRDTSAADLAAYAADEPPGLWEGRRAEWIARHGSDPAARFDESFPPGYFGQRAAFASEGRYGRWLLGLPVAIVIGDTLFMHGGPSRLLSGQSVEEINRRYRTALSEYLTAFRALLSSGLLNDDDPFADRAALAQKRLAGSSIGSFNIQGAPEDSVRRFTAADADPILDADGPNWYRGAALCNEASESDVLKPLLEGLGVKRLVVGHTVTPSRRVSSRFGGAGSMRGKTERQPRSPKSRSTSVRRSQTTRPPRYSLAAASPWAQRARPGSWTSWSTSRDSASQPCSSRAETRSARSWRPTGWTGHCASASCRRR